LTLIVLGGLFVLLYALGKIIGVIHSPIWVDMARFITFGTVITIAFSTGILFQRLGSLEREVTEFKGETKQDFKEVKKVIHSIQERLLIIETKLTLR
jgi:uncharacterized membrane protein YhdT